MRHARTDYDRIQDPAANKELLEAYDNAMQVTAFAASKQGVVAAGGAPAVAQYQLVARTLSTLARLLSPQLSLLVNFPNEPHAIGGVPIAEDEPVFILRAQDMTAPGVVDYWASLNREDLSLYGAVRKHANLMREWQQQHGRKQADTPRELLR